jgi:hypothetical protein
LVSEAGEEKMKNQLKIGFLAAAMIISLAGNGVCYAKDGPPASGYGTGGFFDEGSQLGPEDFSVIKDGVSASSETDEKSTVRATASADKFEISILLEDGSTGRMAGAQAASGYAVTGLPEGQVAAGLSFSIEGKITAASSGAFAVNFIVFDFRGNFLADISFVGERIVNPATGEIFQKDAFAGSFCPDPAAFPLSCNGPSEPPGSRAVKFFGEGTRADLPVFLPASPGNGIIAELWGNTDDIKAEFLSYSALKGSLPPGVTIKFSTGQTFAAPR